MMRAGWDIESGVFVHLDSEAAIRQDESGWTVIDTLDEPVRDGFPSLEAAQTWCEGLYAEHQSGVDYWREQV